MMEEKRLRKTLPEDLVERIVSMMPFPAIFKARGLSKSWLAKFSPVSRHEEEEKKQAAVTFQKLVRQQSTKWSIFLIYCDEDFISACDRQRQQWISFPMPSFRREKHPTSLSPISGPSIIVLGINGTLLYCATPSTSFHTSTYYTFYVVNIITREWKKLPDRPILISTREWKLPDRPILTDNRSASLDRSMLSPILVWDTSLETYKLFVLHGYKRGNMFNRWYVQIYESTLGSWSTKNLVEGVARLHRAGQPYGSPVYLNGVLYACTSEPDEPRYNMIYLITFNIEKGSFEELALPMNQVIGGRGARKVHLVVCCAKLMMIVTWSSSRNPYHTSPDAPCVLLHVLTVDVGSKQLLEVTSAPPDTFEIDNFLRVCSDGKCIFFQDRDDLEDSDDLEYKLTYNVQEDEWDYVDLPLPIYADARRRCQSAFFSPGLNPFAEV